MWNAMDNSSFGQNRFDYGGATGTGGFLNTSNINSPSSAADKNKSERLANVVPVTVAQILKMPESDENLKIGSLTAKIVTFVGLVESVDVQSTKITYIINDCSGPGIEVQIWIGENEDLSKKISNIQENMYVRVTGAIRSMKGKRLMIAFKIDPIKSLNEISIHMLEVVHTSMSIANMDKKGSSSMPMDMQMNTASTLPLGMSNSTDTYASSTGFASRLSKPQQIVLHAITSCREEQGISIHDLFNNLKSLNRQSIHEAIEFLSNEGHIYSTIDDDHFKATDSV